MISQQDSDEHPLNKNHNAPSEKPINLTISEPMPSMPHQNPRRKQIFTWGIVVALIAIIVILAIVLPYALSRKQDDDTGPIAPGGGNLYILDPNSLVKTQSSLSGIISMPENHVAALYQQTKDRKPIKGNHRKSDPCQKTHKKVAMNWRLIQVDMNNAIVPQLSFKFDMVDHMTARLTMTDANNKRYSVPDQVLHKPQSDDTMRLEMLGFSYQANPFSFSFRDVLNASNTFFSSDQQSLVFMDKYIQMDLELPSQRLYGFGERVREFGIVEGTWTMYATGQDSPYDDGRGRKGLYGVHPFLLVQTEANKNDFVGLFFRNSNAMSPVIRYTDQGKAVLSYITIGGQLEAYFIMHGPAKKVISQYHNIIGKPYLPPFWSLGWQQASWKYKTLADVEFMVKSYKDEDFPLDVVYFDIEYMDRYADFSVDNSTYAGALNFSQLLHQNNQRLIVIIDAAMSAEEPFLNKYYRQGNQDGIFIQSSIGTSDRYGHNLISKVWPKKAVFVDWLHDKCPNTWYSGLNDLRTQVQYDGLWIDMNEATTFAHGEIDGDSDQESITYVTQEPMREPYFSEQGDYDYSWFDIYNGDIKISNDTYHLPFVVRNSLGTARNYDNMTLSLNATHPGYKNETEYNLHSLYGHMMAWRTYNYLLQSKDERPFVLSRSTFASSGRYTSHWLGDNLREWRYLRFSISGIMNMNIFGIPHVGADVCGFFGPKRDDEMCLRWIQLSTFYPIARAHQNKTYVGRDSEFSEVYRMAEPYKSMARTSLFYRYSFVRLMYTCLFEVSLSGGTCFDPLFYHYPNDGEMYKDYEHTFMFANHIKVSPILESLPDNSTEYKAYFPKGKWVSIYNLGNIIDCSLEGRWVNLKLLPVIQSHLREGSIIPYQDNLQYRAKNTVDLLKLPITLIAHRNKHGIAQGSLFLDQGITQSELSKQEYEHYQLNLQQQSLQILRLDNGQVTKQHHLLEQILIADAADLESVNFAYVFDHNMSSLPMSAEYIKQNQTLRIIPNEDLRFSDIKNIYYGRPGDLNLCDPQSYQYRVKDEEVPGLSGSKATVILEHMTSVLPNIEATLQFIDRDIINVKWTWQLKPNGSLPQGKREPFEVPHELLDTKVKGEQTQALSDFITITSNPFTISFKSSRNTTDTYLTIKGMLFDSYMNWINTELSVPSGDQFKGIWGLGERANKDFFYEDGVYSLWNRDQGTPDEDGKAPSKGMYGSHPFYMFRHGPKSYVGVLTKLANAQDWYITNDKSNGVIDLRMFATGGIADLYIMTDQARPLDILDRYFSIVGDPVLIPQWALGWHQSKWGYTSVKDLRDVVEGYENHGIPLEAQWIDIDYMDNYKDFSYDKEAFKGLPEFVDELHQSNKKFVAVLDAGIAMRPESSYGPYQQGKQQGLFLKVKDGQDFIGKAWPNEVVFPDFFNNKTQAWWDDQLDQLFSSVKFDGIWHDMNEISSFCNGVCRDDQKEDYPVKSRLPYTPTSSDIEWHTVTLDVYHSTNMTQVDTHSLYGIQETKATHHWFQVRGNRSFILSRSSFSGQGKFGSVWLGDNFASKRQMGHSITQVMLMNMFGIPLVGADVCGFVSLAFAELCARWHVVGAFYPFSRNNKMIDTPSELPWSYPDMYEPGVSYTQIMTDAIYQKYSMIRYYYTQLLLMSLGTEMNYRRPLYQPLFFEFPEDLNAYQALRYNIMLGPSLKLSVNSDSVGVSSTDFYFPAGTWCDIVHQGQCIQSVGQNFTLSAKAYDYYLHLRGGHIVPYQNAKGLGIKNTKELQTHPVEFHILGRLNGESWEAEGVYANDDGQTLNLNGKLNLYSINAFGNKTDNNGIITVMIEQRRIASDYDDRKGCSAINMNDFIGEIFIYNASSFRKSDNYSVTGIQKDGTQTMVGKAVYDQITDRIIVTPLQPLCMSLYSELVIQPL